MKQSMKHAGRILPVVLLCALALFLATRCGGGGAEKSAPAATTTAAVQETPDSQISGRVTIQGVTDYSDVIVVAEKTTDGVTARVLGMMAAAENGGRLAAKQALATPGVYTTTTGADGAYTLTVPEGEYTVSAFKQDAVAAQPRAVSARAAAAVTVNFELVATGKIAGTITLPASIKAGNTVAMCYLEGTSFTGYIDASGAYTISNVPVGAYNLVFVLGSTKLSTASSIAVTAGATTTTSATALAIACGAHSDCPASGAQPGYCLNPATTLASCTNIACNTSSDCGTNKLCQNGGTTSASCAQFACATNADCNDNNAATIDLCLNPGVLTASCNNYVPATVISFSPANGATGVPTLKTQFRAVFSQSMNPNYFHTGLCFRVEDTSTGAYNNVGHGWTASYATYDNNYGIRVYWTTTNIPNDTLVLVLGTKYNPAYFGTARYLSLKLSTNYTIQQVSSTNCGGTGLDLQDQYGNPPDLSGVLTAGSFTTASYPLSQ